MSQNADVYLIVVNIVRSELPRLLVALVTCDGGETVDGLWGEIASL